jgi:D-hydroxyproline dehydrogenase subunit alpha
VDSKTSLRSEVVVVGGGPAGIAAAVAAAQAGREVMLLDDNPIPGGQIWRARVKSPPKGEAKRWMDRLATSRTRVLSGVRVVRGDRGSIGVESERGYLDISCERIVLATGAREMFLPFPGWTLPKVMGAGGLQALVKSGLPIEGKRVVVAGTGPLLLAVAAAIEECGARVICICEQAPVVKLARFALGVAMFPRKLMDAARLRYQSRGANYLTGHWVVAATGQSRLESVHISDGQHIRQIECDYLACGFHLVPNVELAQLMGSRLSEGFVVVDEYQQTSQPQVFCAGEPTGIGGLELSLIEGRIAGFAAADAKSEAEKLFAKRARFRKLAKAMNQAFALRPELSKLPRSETLLCRCEDVAFGRVAQHHSWKAAKLHTRCGMGPCQGRVCGPAASFLFGWKVESSRPPVFPVRCSSLAAAAAQRINRDSNGGTP